MPQFSHTDTPGHFLAKHVTADTVGQVFDRGFVLLKGVLPVDLWPQIKGELDGSHIVGELWGYARPGSVEVGHPSTIEGIPSVRLAGISPTLGGLSVALIDIANASRPLESGKPPQPHVSLVHYPDHEVIVPKHRDGHRGIVAVIADNDNGWLTLYDPDTEEEIGTEAPGPLDVVLMRPDTPHSVEKLAGVTRYIANLHGK